MTISRSEAEALDRADPLAGFRAEFAIEDDGPIYFDGNSLGRLPFATLGRVEQLVANEWGRGLVTSWDHWMDLPARAGDLIGTQFLGAEPGETVVGDSTTVNLFKLAAAALDLRPDRSVIVTDAANFPTDRYVFEGLTTREGKSVRFFESDPVNGPDAAALANVLDGTVALVSLSHVGYRNGAMADMAGLTAMAHDAGALVLWDLSHAVGSVPIDLHGAGADLAVGCTYKYLNGGPGAPAFAWVRADLQPVVRQPIWGWFGQREQFEMGPRYDPAPGIGQVLVGSPSVIQTAAVEESVRLLARAGIGPLRRKSTALTGLAVDLFDDWLGPLGLTLGTPRDPARRGAHVSVRRADAADLCERLIADAGVVPDFRTPDSIRLGFAPIYTRFVDVWDGIERLRVLASA